MHKTKLLKSTLFVILSLLAVLGLSGNAVAATPTFDANCGACHGNGNTGTAIAGPVKNKTASGITSNINSVALMASLKPLIGTPTLTTIVAELNPVVAVTCTPPKVRDAATNTCVTPTPVPVTCTPPKVRDVATNTCVTPAPVPVTCTPPKVRDVATNTCVTPAPVPVTCAPPKLIVNGTCTLPPKTCHENDDNDHGKVSDHTESEHHQEKKARSKSSSCSAPVAKSGSVGRKESTSAATDVYQVECAKNSKLLSVAVTDLASVSDPVISIQTTKGSFASGISSDDVDGDADYSSWSTLPQGKGNYLAKVNRSKSSQPGPELYKALFACQDANGAVTKTKVKLKQNQ